MARCLALMLFAALLFGQDRSDWQAVSQLKPGDPIKLSVKGHDSVSGPFQAWTAEEITVGSTTAKRQDVAKVERYRKGVWSRGRTALVGAAVGGGAGAAVGAAVGGCSHNSIGVCVTRAQGAGIVGAAGALVGAVIGVSLPHHRTDLIYSAK